MASRTFLQLLGDLPGRVGDLFARRPGALPAAQLSPDELAARVVASPRANSYLALEPELSSFATDNGLLRWARAGRTAFAVGGIHAHGSASGLVGDFVEALREARFKRGLVFPVAEPERAALVEGGMRSVMVGAEAFVDPADWSLAGARRADLRQMVNRGRKRFGIVTDEVAAGGAEAGLTELYAAWLAERPSTHRMKLVVGSPGFHQPAGRRYFAAKLGQSGDPVAFVTVTPGWSRSGWGVDAMVRSPRAPAGAMDVLLTDVIGALFDEGAERFSLGAAPMAERTPIRAPDHRLLRFLFRRLYGGWLGNRLFRFETLARYKDKFAPRWEPVYIAAWPRVTTIGLYVGCRMWGLFGPPRLDPPVS